MTVDPFEWMAQCLTCGKVHQRHAVPFETNEQGDWVRYTWADTEDGHVYRPRYVTKDRADTMRSMYRRDTAP